MKSIVLIHGGMMGGWCWKKITERLKHAGYQVLAPTLSGLADTKDEANKTINLTTHITDVCALIENKKLSEIVLVGHSYAGLVITGVAARLPDRIAKLIYLDAIIPSPGESMFDVIDGSIANYLAESAAQFSTPWLVPPAPIEQYHLADAQDREWVQTHVTAHPLNCFTEKLYFDSSKIREIPKAFIKCSRDHALDSMIQRANNEKIPCSFLDSGHFPMIDNADALTDLLLSII